MSLDASSALGSSAADALPKPLPGRDTVIQYGMALLTIVLIAAPLLPVLYQSFLDRALYDSGQQLTLGNFGRLLRTDGFALVIWNTFVFATLTTVISQTLGTLAAVLFGRTDMPFARLLASSSCGRSISRRWYCRSAGTRSTDRPATSRFWFSRSSTARPGISTRCQAWR